MDFLRIIFSSFPLDRCGHPSAVKKRPKESLGGEAEGARRQAARQEHERGPLEKKKKYKLVLSWA